MVIGNLSAAHLFVFQTTVDGLDKGATAREVRPL
jgi:hypothetical protein